MKIGRVIESLQNISTNIERVTGQIATNYEIEDIIELQTQSLQFVAVVKVARVLSFLEEEALKTLE